MTGPRPSQFAVPVGLAGDLTGTLSATLSYSSGSSTATTQIPLRGKRTGADVKLGVVGEPDSRLSLVLDGDALDGSFDQYGTPVFDCSFAR